MARQWIEQLPAFTYFRESAVPVADEIRAEVITELLSEKLPIFGELPCGLYIREPPPAHWAYGKAMTNELRLLNAHSPAGSGLAEISALNALGLTNQVPATYRVAIPSSDPTPSGVTGIPVTYITRDNPRRKALSWHEVTVLEAVRLFWACDRAKWKHVVRALRDADQLVPVGASPLIRRRQLVWAAQTEEFQNSYRDVTQSQFNSVIRRLNRSLPRVVALKHHAVASEYL